MIGDRIGWNRPLPLTRTVLRVRVHTAESAGAFARACEVARGWLESIAQRHGVATNTDDGAFPGDSAPMLRMREVLRSERVASLLAEYRHGDDRNAQRLWHGQLSVSPHPEHGGDAAVLDLSLRLSYRSDDTLDLYPPALFRLLLERVGLDDCGPLSTKPQRIGGSDISELVALVDRPERRHPVLLLSEPLSLDVHTLAEKLAGVAHVMCLTDDAGWALTSRFGRQASAFGGFARLFPAKSSFAEPKASIGMNPQRPFGASPASSESPGELFARGLRMAVLDANTYRFETSAVLRWDEVRGADASAVVSDAPAASATVAPADDAKVRIAELEDVNDSLRRELANVRDENTQIFSALEESELRREALEKEREQSLYLPLGEFPAEEQATLRQMFDGAQLLADRFRHEATLRNQVTDAEDLAERLRARLYDPRYPAAHAFTEADGLDPRPVDWSDFAALDRWRERTFGERLLFHPRVEERLAAGHLTDESAAVLFSMLRALGGPFADMCCGAPGARQRWLDMTQGFVVRRAITPIGLGRVPAEQYDCTFDGCALRGDEQWHIRQRGIDFDGRHACIYYVWFEPREAVLITSMPRHLDTANAHT